MVYFLCAILNTADFTNKLQSINPLKRRYHQFNIQQFYVLPTQCTCVFLCGSEDKQRLFHFKNELISFFGRVRKLAKRDY